MSSTDFETIVRSWAPPAPDRLMGRGHPVGDFLEAYDWVVVEEREGYLRLDVHLPSQVRNPRGQLFGGFTPTYVDLVALHTVRAGRRQQVGPRSWLSTADMRLDYFAPITDDRFEIESEVLNRSGRTHHVQTRFRGREGTLLALAMTTLIETRPSE
jgi:acyl-coenzyme A thioesterase PaaI-like protein